MWYTAVTGTTTLMMGDNHIIIDAVDHNANRIFIGSGTSHYYEPVDETTLREMVNAAVRMALQDRDRKKDD
jgi:hypothetical protein